MEPGKLSANSSQRSFCTSTIATSTPRSLSRPAKRAAVLPPPSSITRLTSVLLKPSNFISSRRPSRRHTTRSKSWGRKMVSSRTTWLSPSRTISPKMKSHSGSYAAPISPTERPTIGASSVSRAPTSRTSPPAISYKFRAPL